MPSNNPTNAALDVRDTASNGDGWTNVVASNGATYSYKYVGGNQPANNGSILNFVGGNQAITTLVFATTDLRYQFASITFTDDNADQLSTHGKAERTRVINDRCTAAIDARYHVLVLDTKVNATIPCDPMIKNQ